MICTHDAQCADIHRYKGEPILAPLAQTFTTKAFAQVLWIIFHIFNKYEYAVLIIGLPVFRKV